MTPVKELIEELVTIDSELRDFIDRSRRPEIEEPLQNLRQVAEEFGKSWSGSSLSYHANVYYADFQSPPPNAYFSVERGMNWSKGDWRECDPEKVHNLIHEKAGNPDLKTAHELGDEGENLFDDKRSEITSILQIALTIQRDDFLSSLKEKAEGLKITTAMDFVRSRSQVRSISTDPATLFDRNIRVAAHINVLAEVFSLQSPVTGCEDLAKNSPASGIPSQESREKHKTVRDDRHKRFSRSRWLSNLEGTQGLYRRPTQPPLR